MYFCNLDKLKLTRTYNFQTFNCSIPLTSTEIPISKFEQDVREALGPTMEDAAKSAIEPCIDITLAVEDDKMAEDITILDIREISVMADYFIIANSDNTSQMNAMKNAVENVMAMHGINAQQIEGGNNSSWILMDYEDVIVHLFSRDDRLFYNLERIWQDGKKVSIEEL